MKTLIVAGGVLRPQFLKIFLKKSPQDLVIAADRGLDHLIAAGLTPDLILGDYDSTALDVGTISSGREIPVERYPAEKNFTDMEAALNVAIQKGSTEIVILGATGGRLDHFLANVQGLLLPLRAGIPARIIDEQNEICLLDGPRKLQKEAVFGTYVSFLPLTGHCEGVTLRGFKYPLVDHALEQGTSLGVSNEIVEEEATVEFQSGILVMVMSKDG